MSNCFKLFLRIKIDSQVESLSHSVRRWRRQYTGDNARLSTPSTNIILFRNNMLNNNTNNTKYNNIQYHTIYTFNIQETTPVCQRRPQTQYKHNFIAYTVSAVQSGPGRRSKSPATLHHRSSKSPQNVDKKFLGVARNIRNCATTTLVGGWKRATIPTSSPGGCRPATEVF